ncbi:hypothetical protein ACFL0S_08195 [Thermodesulfobacteriota bacterium]
MKKHKIKAMTLSLGLILLILTLGSSISMATNSRLICSAAEAVSCSKDGECIRGPVDKVNLPLFFQVDVDNKKVVSLTEAGEVRTSPITGTQSMDGYTIVLGTDVDTGWSMIINEQKGIMTLGVATADTGFTVFGACVDEARVIGDRK